MLPNKTRSGAALQSSTQSKREDRIRVEIPASEAGISTLHALSLFFSLHSAKTPPISHQIWLQLGWKDKYPIKLAAPLWKWDTNLLSLASISLSLYRSCFSLAALLCVSLWQPFCVWQVCVSLLFVASYRIYDSAPKYKDPPTPTRWNWIIHSFIFFPSK